MADTPSDRARMRLKEEMARQKMSQRDLAGILNWSQSRVNKLLNARVGLGLDDLASLCFGLNLSLVEAVRDSGLEFVADMTPSELRILQRVRELPPPVRHAVITILDVGTTPTRRALPRKGERK